MSKSARSFNAGEALDSVMAQERLRRQIQAHIAAQDASTAARDQVAQERNRQDLLDRSADAGLKLTHCSGLVLCKSPGFFTQEVVFPVTFAEKPYISFGWELDLNQAVSASTPPIGYAVVSRWNIDQPDLYRLHFTGAIMAITTLGSPEQRMWLNWTMTGPGFTRVTTSQTTDA